MLGLEVARNDHRHRSDAHNAAIMSVVLLILGGKLIGDAIAGLSR